MLSTFDASNLIKLPDLARPLLEETEKQARRLAHMATINKRVHVARYSKIIRDCLAKMDG